jgi:capsular exopolysaccharide synthesis family protein
MTARVERLDESEPVALQHYPREARVPSAPGIAPDRRPQRAVVAPRTGNRRQLGPLALSVERKLVVSEHASPIVVEQYRRIAAAMHEIQVDQGLKTLMVTSAAPDEGKTLTVANLALTLSESCSRRVLLIDADLRRPQIHEVFRLPNASGLSDLLQSDRGEIPLLELSEHLSVLPAGQSDQPMAALTSDRMRVLLEQFSSRFDWILLDAAPVGFMPDAQLLARLTRAVLLVIAAHSTPYPLINRAIAELDRECVVGVVLNRAELHDIPAARYYQEYYSRGSANN